MRFKKYLSIENSYKEKHLHYVQRNVPSNTKYIVTEKIHGANFSFHYDGEDFRVAKRSQFIAEDDNFYGCIPVVDKYKAEIIELYKFMLEHHLINSGDQLSIYGELYGEGIQKEVAYGEKDFIAFDLFINGQEVGTSLFTSLMISSNIPVVPVLGCNLTLEEALEVPNDSVTKLNPIEDNIMEGTVIKPMNPITLPSGSRLVLKNKNDKFTERSEPKKKKKRVALTPSQEKLLEDVESLINENRLNNVISKLGEVTIQDFGKVLGELLKDVFNDFYSEYDYIKEDIKDDLSLITKLYQKTAQELVRKELLKRS